MPTGTFLWVDSNKGPPGSKASISSPVLHTTSDEAWLTFYYHMYGTQQHSGTLKFSVCSGGDTVWTMSGNQGNEWHEHTMNVSCLDGPVQVIDRMSPVPIAPPPQKKKNINICRNCKLIQKFKITNV